MKITKLSQKGLELNPNRFYVYEHLKPNTGEVFYIGKGCKNRAYQTRSRNNHWTNIVNKYGLEVNIIYKNLTNQEAGQKEIDLIEFYGLDNLCNMTQGGDGCISLKQESRDKISNSLKGKIQSQESKDKRSASLKKTWQNPALRELKRQQSIELNRLGLIGVKIGTPSKKKGKPFAGDKEKLSQSLKNHYLTSSVWNKTILDKEILEKIIEDYNSGNNVFNISKKLKINRKVIYRVLEENNITIRPVKKIIPKDEFYNIYIIKNLSQKEASIYFNCSIANINKLVNLYKIKKNGNVSASA